MEIIGLALVGWGAGLLVNYLADTLPFTRRLSTAVCSTCQRAYPWRDYFTFKKCQNCGSARSKRTWIVQVLAVVLAGLLWFYPPARLGFWPGIGLAYFLGLIALIDIEHRAILHPISIIGAIIGLMIGLSIRPFVETLLGGVAGFLIMLALYYFGAAFARWIGRLRKVEVDEVALGFGDVNLMGVLGLMMGWPEVIGGMLVGFLLGGLVSGGIILVTLVRRTYRPMLAIPYAPFLILGAVVMIYLPK